jgi:hypothetical protein
MSDQKREIYIGGIIPVRGWFFYAIYRYNGRKFEVAFSTIDDLCEYPLHIGEERGDQCVEFEGDQLMITFKDINGDHIDDITFSGQLKFFCIPHADRINQTKPLKIEKITFTLKSYKNESGIKWIFQDQPICDKILKH